MHEHAKNARAAARRRRDSRLAGRHRCHDRSSAGSICSVRNPFPRRCIRGVRRCASPDREPAPSRGRGALPRSLRTAQWRRPPTRRNTIARLPTGHSLDRSGIEGIGLRKADDGGDGVPTSRVLPRTRLLAWDGGCRVSSEAILTGEHPDPSIRILSQMNPEEQIRALPRARRCARRQDDVLWSHSRHEHVRPEHLTDALGDGRNELSGVLNVGLLGNLCR